MQTAQGNSASLASPDYWWYRARGDLLEVGIGAWLTDGGLTLDIGSADGPSVDWINRRARRIPVDINPEGLTDGGVCATLVQLPFPDETFDTVGAFDVIEHLPDESAALTEVQRVLKPGGRLLVAVPAYQWAWTDFDDRAGHYRRYTTRRLVRVLQANGFRVERATYTFCFTLPFFTVDRLRKRLRNKPSPPGLPTVSPTVERLLLSLCRMETALLSRTRMPCGSSVLAAASRVASS